MVSQGNIDHAIDGMFDAIVAPDGWPGAMHDLAGTFDAVCCRFYPQGAGDAIARYPASPDYKPFLDEFLRDGWWRSDHRAARGWPRLAGGRRVLLEHDIASDEERRTLPQYRDLYRRFDVPWWAAVSFRVNSQLWAVPFLRSSRQGPFTRSEAERLLKLTPHFERIIRLSSRLVDASAGATLDVLARISCAAALLDARGLVVRHNGPADRLIGSGLSISGRRLVADDPFSDGRLQTLIAAALAPRAATAFDLEPARIERARRPPLVVDAIPASKLLADAFHQARVILLIADLAPATSASQSRIQAVFGLTPAEARLAATLAGGHDLDTATQRLGLAKGTVRAQLKSIFAKTDTARQAELTALLARFT